MSEIPSEIPQSEKLAPKIEETSVFPTTLTADFEHNPVLKEALDDRYKLLWAERAKVGASTPDQKIPTYPEIEILARLLEYGVVHMAEIEEGTPAEILDAYTNVYNLIQENSTR